jgi:Type IV secretory system Conjugative DNA transfer
VFGRNSYRDRLDRPLLHWTKHDPYSMRQFLDGGCCILGRPGSGKTSASGKALAAALVGYRGSGGLVLASSPTDLAMWAKLFARAGRSRDLIPFGPAHSHRFNLVDFLRRLGADSREIAKAIITIGESIDNDDSRSGGGESDKFWPIQVKATIETATEIVVLADGYMSIPNLHKFIITAAQNPAQIKDDTWKEGYHAQCFAKAFARAKTEIEEANYQLAFDRWVIQWPVMSDKTRSSIEAAVTGILHTFNSGQLRALLSEPSTITPAVMERGKWIFVDMSVGQHGSSGAFVLNALKYGTQRYVLQRDPDRWKNPIVIWADEAGKIVNSADSFYLTESRKFGGATVFLAQSMQSFHAAMPGERGKSQAEVLLGSFSTKIAHAIGDPGTADWLSKLLGKEIRTLANYSDKGGDGSLSNSLFGQGSIGFGFSEHMEWAVEPKYFMHGLRTGGKANGSIADAFVIRSGESFSNGANWLLVPFSQR